MIKSKILISGKLIEEISVFYVFEVIFLYINTKITWENTEIYYNSLIEILILNFANKLRGKVHIRLRKVFYFFDIVLNVVEYVRSYK